MLELLKFDATPKNYMSLTLCLRPNFLLAVVPHFNRLSEKLAL